MSGERISRLLIRSVRESRRKGRWQPQDGPQRQFVEDQETQDVVFGGARGGGKTIGLLLSFREHALRYGRDARGILFRRSYTELQEVIRLSRDVFGEAGWTYHETEKRWTSPQGAILFLRYLDGLSDAEIYQGWSATWLGFDELQNWPTLEPIDRLWGILRSPRGVPCIRRSTCNPGGPGHVAVRERYHPDRPGVPLTLQPIASLPSLTISAKFIPARLEDNPKLMEGDPDYENRLAAAGGKALFEAWRYGRWDVIQGAFFDCWNEETMTVDPSTLVIEPWHQRWISGDWGFADDCVIHWHSIDEDRRVTTYLELKFNKTTPDQIAHAIGAANRGERIAAFFFSPDAFAQRSSFHTIADEIGDVLRDYGIPRPTAADNDRIGGWVLLYQMLKSGHWRISRSCTELIKSLPLLQRKDTNLEDVDDSPVDHAPDSARYGLKTWMKEARVPREERVRREVEERVGPEPSKEAWAAMTDEEKERRNQAVYWANKAAERKVRARVWRRPRRWA